MTIQVIAPGKINLYLAVGRGRPDGYHPLATVFQAVDIYDEIDVEPAEDLSLTLPGSDLPGDDTNLAWKAAVSLAECANVPAKAAITIRKNIPVAGGMAGGSADAAGTLVALDELWGTRLRIEELIRLGAKLGADVPFSVLGGSALGRKRGDELQLIHSSGLYTWVFVTQEEGLSTAAVFTEFDRQYAEAHAGSAELSRPDVPESFLNAMATGDIETVLSLSRNDLEAPARALHTGVAATLDAARDLGYSAIMSGSGPTVAVHVPADTDPESIVQAMESAVPGTTAYVAHGPVSGARVLL